MGRCLRPVREMQRDGCTLGFPHSKTQPRWLIMSMHASQRISMRPGNALNSARAVVLLPVKFRAQREVVLTGLHRVVVAWS